MRVPADSYDHYDIPFTQFLRPDGRRRQVSISRPPSVWAHAKPLIDAGCRFEIEELSTGHVSMTVERDDKDGETEVLSQRIVKNGILVPLTVDDLVHEAFKQWSEGVSRT